MLKQFLLVFFAVVACTMAAEPFALVGTVTNTTNPKQITSANAMMTFDAEGHCILRVFQPLYGSGTCSITNYDEKTGYTKGTSEGVLFRITWEGTFQGSTFEGKYRVESPSTPDLPQWGTFRFTQQTGVQKPLKLEDVLKWSTFKSGQKEMLLVQDGDVITLHDTDGKYAGLRILLDKDGNPQIRIEDSQNVSVYSNVKTNERILTWVRQGEDGFFVQPISGGSAYFDRFMQPTGWSSVDSGGQTTFVHDVNGDLELFDAGLKPLGVRSAKTPDGRLYWTKTTGDVTEFYDASFRPLNWYSFQMNGATLFAHATGKNQYAFYDANMRPLKQPNRQGFWANLLRGIGAGLAASQQAAAYRAQQTHTYVTAPAAPAPYSYSSSTIGSPGLSTTTTTDSYGNVYTTNSQRIGTLTFSNTIGSNGYTANSTGQQLGTFEYINGNSTAGNYSGTTNRIGNFDFTNLTTPSGNWNGTSTQLGNFTFHNFTGPNGQALTGTTTQIGNFIFTDIH
jgi:hypothetical protein